jgi:hypothetical protein
MDSIYNDKHGIFQIYTLRSLIASVKSETPFQRVIDNDKVQKIKESLVVEKENVKTKEIIQTGIIHLAQYQGNLFILDGQHRFEAYKQLDEPTDIYIQKWQFKNEEEMKQKFTEINSNTTIEHYVISKNVNTSQKEAYDILINYIQSEYKEYLKVSDSPNFPNININHFRKIIHLIDYFKTCDKNNIITTFIKWNNDCLEKLKLKKDERKRVKSIYEHNYKLYINRHLLELWKFNASKVQ